MDMSRIAVPACLLVYITAPDAAAAKRIGRSVVEERLAACANVIDGMSSIYWWQGKVEEASEAVLILKTTVARAEELIARVKTLHSYECPAIVALPIARGSAEYLDWIGGETAADAARRPG
jgi:periplasmic divalent cation tolerance protein